MDWTRVTDPDKATKLLPAWFTSRMIGLRGSYGFLLTTGDVMRVAEVMAVNHGSDGTLLADVLLDHAGVPDGVDEAWHGKHYLGAPVPGAVLSTINLAHVIAAVEFVAPVEVEAPRDLGAGAAYETPMEKLEKELVRPSEGWR